MIKIYLYIYILILIIRLFIFLLFFYFFYKDLIYFFEWEIFNHNSCNFTLNFLFDWIRLLFIAFVLFISSVVIFYRASYILSDKFKIRFIFLVFLFILSIIFLIISPNLISILLGWDGLGLVSFCLVIYFQNFKSYNAGILTVFSNRIGDVALLISIAWIIRLGSWRFYFYLNFMKLNYIFIFIIILAAITKRAQIPFSSWLPAAIAAPTPVSALVHSSTLVTAGVYLLIRFNFYLINFKELKIFFLLIRILTIFIAGLGANYETDLKKIIALSTLSQLGLIIGILFLGFEKLAFFHLLTHALFKALLFLCAGIFIHRIINFQDVRTSGGFNNQIILTYIYFNISRIALCGIPFLAGFYSKDLILEIILLNNVNLLIIFFFFFSTGLTVIYSFRLIKMRFENYLGFSILCLDEVFYILFPSRLLIFISIVGGSFLMWLIFPFLNLIILSFFLKILIVLICLLGALFGYFLFNIKKIFSFIFFNLSLYFKFIFIFIWFLTFIFCRFLNFYFLKFINKYKLNLDLGWLEFLRGIFFKKNFLIYLKLFIFNSNLKFFFYFLLSIIILVLFLLNDW